MTPHINPEGLVILDVSPEISQLTGTTVPIGDGVAAPVIAKRSAQSRVGISNGQTIVIGGLMEDRKTADRQQGADPRRPPAGSARRSAGTQSDKTKTELLIFLTPHVAAQPDLLKPMSQDEMNGTKLTPGAVAPGVFSEHLRGMERGTLPDTRPATQPTNPVLEIGPATTPTTQPSDLIGPTTTGPIRLPFP